jgi:hypothetical protein
MKKLMSTLLLSGLALVLTPHTNSPEVPTQRGF